MKNELLVEIEIQQGIVNVLNKPKGVKLIVRDTDTDGCSPEFDKELLGNEKDGYYFEAEYEASVKI